MKSVAVLEKLLQFWEDKNFILACALKIRKSRNENIIIPTTGPTVHHQELRHYLQSEVFQTKVVEDERFGTDKLAECADDDFVIGMCAYNLAWWVSSSRRIFMVEKDLQLLLDATSLEGVTMEDIRFPFGSFLVELENPIIDKSGLPHSNAMIIVKKIGEQTKVYFSLFCDNLLNYRPYTVGERSDLTKAISKKKWDRAAMMATKMEARTLEAPGDYLTTREIGSDEYIDKALVATVGKENSPPPHFTSAFRTMLGLCLYLKSLPTSSPLVTKWETTERVQSVRGRAISDNANVCSVASSFKLSNEERQAFSDPAGQPTRSFGEKCCHFRRGTWCRPKNSSPDTPRTEWRRPTIVRKDRLKPGELPKGAQTILVMK